MSDNQTGYQFAGHTEDGLAVFQYGEPEIMHAIPEPPAANPSRVATTPGNQPKLSKRAQRALDVLADGGMMVHRLERDSYTGREQFHTRFCASASWSSVVKGLGAKTRYELEDAGFSFVPVNHTSVSTYYRLSHSGAA